MKPLVRQHCRSPFADVRPFPWFATVFVAVCLVFLGSDLLTTPGLPHWVWVGCYYVPAAAIVLWRATGLRAFLVWACGPLFVVSFARFVLIGVMYGSMAGVACHGLIAVFAALLLRAQWAQSLPLRHTKMGGDDASHHHCRTTTND